MIDQCKDCLCRSDIVKCKEIECPHHENWYSLKQQETIDNQRMAIIDLKAALRTCFNTSNGALSQYRGNSNG